MSLYNVFKLVLVSIFFGFCLSFANAQNDEVYEENSAIEQGENQEEVVSEEVVDEGESFEEDPLAEDEKILENLSKLNENKFIFETFIYSRGGKRDPFRPTKVIRRQEESSGSSLGATLEDPKPKGAIPPLERFDLSEFKLTGIMWDIDSPRALVRDPQKNIHYLVKDSKIGNKNGYVASIREGEVVIVEREFEGDGKERLSTQVLKIGR